MRLAGTRVMVANPSGDVYGSDLQMLQSVAALLDQGATVTVVLPADGPLVAKLQDRGAAVRFVPFPVLRRANQSARAFAGMAWAAAAAVPRLVRHLRSTRPDVLYVNTVTLPWWLLAGRLAGVPTVAHLHEAENTDSLIVRRALIAPLRLADAVAVISESTMQAMSAADRSLRAKAHLIYNGVPQPPEQPVPAERTGTMRAVVVGRLSPRKAPHLALEAIGRLRSEGLDIELELAGTAFPGYEWYVDQLRRRSAEPDLAGAVSFAGYCSPIWPNLAAADLVLAPSVREPFGNAVVEAQYALRPVVATAALGHLESITDGETGLLVPADDVDAMAAAIRALVVDADLAERLATRARSAAIQRFGTERYDAEMVQLVGRLAAGHRPTTGSGAGRTVRILGTHGVPAAYGGFETAAEQVGLYLLRQGWRVVVYCQVPGDEDLEVDTWHGLERVRIPERRPGWLGTSSFDLKSIRHAMGARRPTEAWLTFGYNTGVLDVIPRLRGVRNVINMDGMEWTRSRWGPVKQGILLGNERLAGLVGNRLIADHPEIARYLRRHFGRGRVRTIAYGAHEVEQASPAPAADLGLQPGSYGIVVCRPIPENSILEIVRAWSRRPRGRALVVVGPFDTDDPYQTQVRSAASEEVVFVGAVFDQQRLSALRFHAGLYLHGHTVGGTNPSLVEAMAAGNAVLAQDNVYNRWVAGPENAYFHDDSDLSVLLDEILEDDARLRTMGASSRARFRAEFTWDRIGRQYEEALLECLPTPVHEGASRR